MSQDRLTRRSVLRGMAVGGTASAIGAGTAGGTEHNRYIIGTKDAAGTNAAKGKATQVHREFDFGDIGNAVSGLFPEEAREFLEQRRDVRYIERDGRMRAIGETLEWGVDRIDADKVHSDGITGDGAHIAILDTGIDSDHEDLKNNLGTGKAYYQCGTKVDGSSCSGSTNCKKPWEDDNGHGTHCTGIAAALDNSKDVIGVAPDATLHAVKVLDCTAWGYYSEIAAGLEYVTDQGWDVANVSLGGTSSSSTLQDACQYAQNNGVLMVAAAGNSGPCSDCIKYPAAYDSVIAVSATDSNDNLADFSSTGPEIELAAPGENIESIVPGGGTESWSGTSMACSHVSGAAGLLMANGYTASETRDRAGSTAEDIGLGDNKQGKGLLDANTAASNIDTTPPTAPSNLSSPAHSETTVELTWDASSNSSSGVAHYNIYVDGSKRLETTTTGATISGLSTGTSYEFYVTAVDNSGNEPDSSEILTVTTWTRIGESGRMTVGQQDRDVWHSVSLNRSCSNPVVLVGVPSHNGPDPVHTRVRNVASDSFEFNLEEWLYRGNGYHSDETVAYMILEAGTYSLPDGARIEIGTVDANHNFVSVNFAADFGSGPVVMSQAQTENGLDAIVTRHRNPSKDSFEIRIQEEESRGWHVTESIGYVAIEKGTGSI